MLFPYGTDAPLYHYPIATVSSIVLNVALFIVTGMGAYEPTYSWLILDFEIINPVQWITAAFMHASWVHLVGNMIFLWCFGLVTEGKLGTPKFIALYLGMALFSNALVQVPLFLMGHPGGALGASGVISALMVVAFFWAPDNEMNCIFAWSFWYIKPVDIPIIGFVGFYFALQVLPLVFTGIVVSTPLLHLIGMAAGIPFAYIMLKRNWVDCEGWDLFSRYGKGKKGFNLWDIFSQRRNELRQEASILREARGGSGREALEQIMQNPNAFNANVSAPPTATAAAPRAVPTPLPPAEIDFRFEDEFDQFEMDEVTFSQSFCTAVDVGNTQTASAMFDQISQPDAQQLPHDVLVKYITLLNDEKKFTKCLGPLAVLASRGGTAGQMARLRIAKLQFLVQNQPAAAIRTLELLPPNCSPKVATKKQQLLNAIQDANG